MATSTQRAVSDGTLVLLDLSINYLDRSEIAVFVNALPSTTWAWVGTTDKQIRFTPAVANGLEVLVKRTTDLTKLRHSFSGGAAFEAAVLDEALKQVLHIAQEGAEIRDFTNEVSMNGFKITNLADAVNPADALSLGKALTVLAPQVASATASAATATTQATNASNSAAAAAASYDSFDDRYLGPKAVAPTLDNDGAALLAGALYWDTVLSGMRAYSGTAWVTLPGATAALVANTPSGSIQATTVQAAINELDSDVSVLASTKQPLDDQLTTLAAITVQQATDLAAVSTFMGTVLNDADPATARATLELATVAQVEAEAGVATTTRSWTAERVKQAIAALAPFAKSYTSANQTITAAGVLTLAHGLGATPTLVKYSLVCLTDQAGYLAGDVIEAGDLPGYASSSRGVSIVATITDLVCRFGSAADVFVLLNKTTGVATAITPANFALRVRAWK